MNQILPEQNLLGIPQELFGTSGIRTGQIIYDAVLSRGLQLRYEPVTQKITVLHSSDLDPSILRGLLERRYDGWYPVVEDDRSPVGDLQIRLSCLPNNPSELISNLPWHPRISNRQIDSSSILR